ncbi:MAG TPA: FtsX-like permease family protein [Chloroflexia bacterium]|nr:FtsX-like permease family protein [Chloroflexia bacterium]
MWSLLKAFNDIRRRKVRSLLTITGIFVGVAGIVAIVATARNLEQAQRFNYSNASQDDMRWWAWNNTETTEYALAQLPNVAAVQRRASYVTKFRAGPEWHDLTFYGYPDYSDVRVNKMEFVEGHPPGKGEVAFEISARDLEPDLKVGDEIIYRSGSDNTEKRLTISGFARSPAYPSAAILNFTVAYASEADVRQMLGISGDNEILLKIYDMAQRDETRRLAEDVFRKRNIQFGGYVGRDPNNYLGKQELDTLVLLLLIFSGIGLVISGFLVANTLSAIVTEQVGEIGTLKALGAVRKQVLQIYIYAALIYGLIGSALGIVAGFILGKILLGYLGSTVNFVVDNFFFQPEALLLGLIVGVGVTLVAALIPAWSGTAISVRKALGSYGISSTYGEGWIDRLLARIRKVPPLVAMSLRNLARRKTRNLITFGVVALSCAAFLAAQSASASLERTITDLYGIYGADGWVQFNNRLNDGFAERLKTVDGVEIAEPWSKGRATVKASQTDLWGVPYDTQLYQKPVVEGRWFGPNENNVALATTTLAQAKNIHVGDTIEIEVGKVTDHLLIIGLLEDNSKYLGSTSSGKLFTPKDTAERLLRHLGTADFFSLSFARHDKAFVDQTMSEVESQFKQFGPATLAAYSDKDSAQQITAILQLMLYAMVAIIGLIGAIGVINTLTLNVLERRREIGVLRSLGGSNVRLVQVFLTEGLMLGLLGFIVGLVLGYPLATLLVGFIGQSTFPLNFVFDLRMVGLTLLFALALTAAASLGPALAAARVKISQTIRYG